MEYDGEMLWKETVAALCHELCETAGWSVSAHWSCSVFPHSSLKTVHYTGE